MCLYVWCSGYDIAISLPCRLLTHCGLVTLYDVEDLRQSCADTDILNAGHTIELSQNMAHAFP